MRHSNLARGVVMAWAASAVAGQVHGAGFALIEQGAAGMGTAFAGAAAVADDPSTVFFNPAGMSRLRKIEVLVGASAINLKADFTGSSTRPAALGGGTNTGGNGGNAGGIAGLPIVFLVVPVGDSLSLGLGISAPFGLKTEYDDGWVGRFQGIKSELTTINVNPSVAWRITDGLSVGAGINYQQLDAELTNAVVLGAGQEGRTRLTANDDGWGWNAGVLWQATPGLRIGAAHRSSIKYTLDGSVLTTSNTGAAAAAAAAASGGARADVELPSSTSLSFVQALSPQLDLLADVSYTHWSGVSQVTVVNTANGTVRDILNFDLKSSWRFSVGGKYALSDKWALRAGLAYDKTPVKDADHRTVRLPDADRTWLAVGARWTLSPSSTVDMAYSHLFLSDVDVNFTRGQLTPGTTNVSAATVSRVTGSYSGSVDLLSVQYVHRF